MFLIMSEILFCLFNLQLCFHATVQDHANFLFLLSAFCIYVKASELVIIFSSAIISFLALFFPYYRKIVPRCIEALQVPLPGFKYLMQNDVVETQHERQI